MEERRRNELLKYLESRDKKRNPFWVEKLHKKQRQQLTKLEKLAEEKELQGDEREIYFERELATFENQCVLSQREIAIEEWFIEHGQPQFYFLSEFEREEVISKYHNSSPEMLKKMREILGKMQTLLIARQNLVDSLLYME